MIARDAASGTYSETIGHAENQYEVHFSSRDSQDAQSALMNEARNTWNDITNTPDCDFSVTADFTPMMGESFGIKAKETVASVAAAKFVSTNFTNQAGSSKPYTDWSMKDISGIKPCVEDGAFTESIISLFSQDVTQQGVKATGTYSNIQIRSDSANSIAANHAAEFLPGTFNDDGVYTSGSTKILMSETGTPLPVMYAGNWIQMYGAAGSAISHVYEHDVWGYDRGYSDETRDVAFTRTMSGIHGAVSGQTYSSTSSPFSLTHAVTGAGSSATYMIPDKPENRMRYRPSRSIVDAAMYAEQKLLLAPIHERLDNDGGKLGLPYHGTPTPFRFQTLVEAGFAQQYLLEKAATKTRMVGDAQRSRLVFTKLSLMDPNTERSILPDTVRLIDAEKTGRQNALFTSPLTTSMVIDRQSIRDIQRGRQQQRLTKS